MATFYSAPLCEVRKSGLRASILAGSQVVKAKDFEGWNARKRSVDGVASDESKQLNQIFSN
jgi:hypothetical protein